MICRLALLALAVLLASPAPAFAHRPYFKPYSGWIEYKGQEYQLQGWHGDGIMVADPVVIVLRARNGGISAVSDMLASAATGICPDINWCYAFDLSSPIPFIFRLVPETIKSNPNGATDREFNYPESQDISTFGFERSYNYLLVPIAILKHTIKTWYAALLLLGLPVVLFVALLEGIAGLKRQAPRESQKWKRTLAKSSLTVLAVAAGFLCCFIAILYGLFPALLVLFGLIFSLARGIRRMFRKNDLKNTQPETPK